MFTIIVAEGPDNTWIKKDAGSLQRWWNATKRNLGDTARGFREGTNFSRMIGEKMFESYHDQMEKLRDTDEVIRSWTKDLDNCLDRALEANSKGQMLDAILWMSQINSRLKIVSREKDQLSSLRDDQLEEFYGEREHPLQNDYFHSDPTRIIEAGMMDDIGRWVTRRKMENMYKRRLAEQKTALRTLLNSAKSTVHQVDALLSRMGKARASGNIEVYITDLSKISALQEKFEGIFRELYDKHFKGMVERLRQKENKTQVAPKELPKNEIPALETPQLSSIMEPNDPMYTEELEKNVVPIGPHGTVPVAPSQSIPSW